MLHKYFTKTYLINLDFRKDRLHDSTNECKRFGIEFERLSAIDGRLIKDIIPASQIGEQEQYWNNGAAGMCQSLVKLFKIAKENKFDSVLIMEDDIEFGDLSIIEKTIKQIPDNWESLFFGLNKRGLSPYSENWMRIDSGYALHCHAVRSTVYDLMIDKLSAMNNPADKVYDLNLFKRGNSYLHVPTIAWQRPSHSSITGQWADYEFLKK